MHRFAPVALATLLAATALAHSQAPTPFVPPQPTGRFTDPANLAGERVRPRNGRELPIDGGLSANGQPDNALGLAQMLRRLNTRASLMLIVAHPDDEDGGMLTYYSRGLGARVAVLTLTRGEGGQNAMTGDFEDALGLLRTQELLSADRYMGVDQMFGTEVDFGFTKTKAEAFQKWNHQRVLYDAVRAVRIYRPLVIAAVFSGAVTDGHGQHQVSGEIAQEVFKAADDPNVFPELTKEGILPWQPLKVYARVPFSRVSAQGLYDYATGQTVPAEFTNYVTGQKFTTEPTADVTINEGATDPLLSTCAANPTDLPASLRPTNTPSSRPDPERAQRAEGGVERPLYSSQSATGCTPLSYVQFARIGLGLQRSQIGGGDRVSRAGRVDVGYHLYGSRVCAPGLPNPTPGLCSVHATTTTNNHDSGWPTLSQSERVGYRAAREKTTQPHLNRTSFTTAASDNPALANQPSFFDGIDTSVAGIGTLSPNLGEDARKQLAKLDLEIEYATRLANDDGSNVATLLAQALKTDDALIQLLDNSKMATQDRANLLHELRIKRAQLNNALALSLGLSMQANAADADLPANINATASLTLREVSSQPLTYRRGWSQNTLTDGIGDGKSFDGPSGWSVSQTNPLTRECGLSKSQTAVTRPYFNRKDVEQPFYDLLNPDLRNAPATPPALSCWSEVEYKDVAVTVGAVAEHDAQPVSFVPPASIMLPSHAQVLPLDQRSLLVTLILRPVGVRVEADIPNGWKVTPDIEPKHSELGFKQLRLEPSGPLSQPVSITAIAMPRGGPEVTEGFRPVGYGTLPRTNFYTPATLRVVPVDLKLPPPNKRRIAYLPGTGDDVPAALASIGLTPTILKVSDLTPAKLSQFDTVILGVRTYNAHPDLHGAPTQALLDFARNGGNVVVQYQTPEFGAADAPYPLTTHNERVIDETAPVKLLDPTSPLLTTPNKITPADFNNWIEERGHGFLDTWDSHYTALTETRDPGAPAEHIEPQEPQRGGLITVPLGKGRWTYCAFALYRQLPEAVPGACRLFVNLLNP